MTTTRPTGARRFADRLAAVPLKPGVYLMRDASGNILYAGKAAVLRNRLRSYFGSLAGLAPKIRRMVENVDDFEYIVTESEQEALLLENSLIKRHQPRYNARLKDDKTYPYIKIDLNEPFPQVYVTRRTANDGARYFGPFASAGSVRKTLDLLKRLFPYRSCTKAITGTDERPCLDFHIKRCVGPCIGAVSREEYMEVIDQVVKFLDGNTREIVREIQDTMLEASAQMEFERAAALRDRLLAIERVYEGQKVVSMTNENMDVIGVASGRNEAWVEIFFIRHGNLTGRDHFIMQGTEDDATADITAQFVAQFYGTASHIPRRVLVPEPLPEKELIQGWLAEKRGGPVELASPQRGEKRRLIQMVRENAEQGLQQLKLKWMADSDLMTSAMAELQEELSLPRLPCRIECYDVSHTQGASIVASMAVFEDGRPKTAHYRRFKMKTVSGNDDFASMREVLSRRFKRLKEADRADGANDPSRGQDSFQARPDLVLIDGGKGQLSAAVQTFLELGVEDVPLASLAKQREELFVPHSPEPVVLPRSSQALFLVQRVRDEAHRFAVTFHRGQRAKASLGSALDLVPGIGPKRRRHLIRKFGSVKGVREASLEDLAAAPGMTTRLAAAVKEHL